MKTICLTTCLLLCLESSGEVLPEIQTYALAHPDRQEDFPALTLDDSGNPWLAYILYDGTNDVLQLARLVDDHLENVEALSIPGVVHQASITRDRSGVLHVFWSQLQAAGHWNLLHRVVREGRVSGPPVLVAENAIFADCGTDDTGRVWAAWQSFRGGPSDIFVKHRDRDVWSPEIKVSDNPEGDWAPRLAFVGSTAFIAYDCVREGNFDIVLARVGPDHKVSRQVVAETPSYEARVSIAASPDRKALWLAWERGLDRWGGDRRGHDVEIGLNANKRIDLVRVDVESGAVTRTPNLRGLMARLAKSAKLSLNLPEVFTDIQGRPWLLLRYANRSGVWKVALTRYDVEAGRWATPLELPKSSFGQERPSAGVADKKGQLWLVRPSDLRKNKRAGVSGIYLSRVAQDLPMPLSGESVPWAPYTSPERNDSAGKTPLRPRGERHSWTVGGKTYRLYFGDFHRHTSVSNCRTATDGSVVEQYRYGLEAGGLDYLGPSDHTDAGKPYDPYEWWENQKLSDLFLVPGFFNSFYVYEREQRWPWGHRNVVFAERGGPIVYIKRGLYRSSPWQAQYPVAEGGAVITPMELWEVLEKSGKRVAVISHTGATGMGTNWDAYKDPIDGSLESVVEIYQGARVSYEGIDLPQPTVGLRYGASFNRGEHDPEKQVTDFRMYKPGVYQNALKNGHRLGVFASSDHISTHTAFGGVYAESFTREGILDGIAERRTIAATDKIFLDFTCNGKPMGSMQEYEGQPAFEIRIQGTAAIEKVTIVRNETNYQAFQPGTVKWETRYTDPEPLPGMNRYYLRVEQVDGNMAWASPVWVMNGEEPEQVQEPEPKQEAE